MHNHVNMNYSNKYINNNNNNSTKTQTTTHSCLSPSFGLALRGLGFGLGATGGDELGLVDMVTINCGNTHTNTIKIEYNKNIPVDYTKISGE